MYTCSTVQGQYIASQGAGSVSEVRVQLLIVCICCGRESRGINPAAFGVTKKKKENKLSSRTSRLETSKWRLAGSL